MFKAENVGVYSQIIAGAVGKPSIGDETIVVLVDRDDDDNHYHRDAPASQGEPEHVAWHIAIEDLHQGQIHVHGLEPHPSKGDQQEVVKEPGGGDAEAHSLRVEGQPGVRQEDQIEK